MKFTKVMFGNKRLKDIVVGASRFDVFKYRLARFMRKVFIVSFVIGAIAAGYDIGNLTAKPETVYAEKQVEVPIDGPAPVLDRIAQCESSNMQIKNGQVLMMANQNGSVDVGVMQINIRVWGKKAAELGYDLTKEADNRSFAHWLYANYGTEPWIFTKGCWNK